MAFYSIASNRFELSEQQGEIEIEELEGLLSSFGINAAAFPLPISYSLLLIIVDRSIADDKTFRFTMFSPEYVLYLGLTEQEFRSIDLPDHSRTLNYELLFVISGTAYQTVEGKRQCYQKNDACFLAPQITHSLEYDTDFRAVRISYSQDYMKGLISGDQTRLLSSLMYRDYTNFYIQTPNRTLSFTKDIQWCFWQIIEGLLFSIPSNSVIINMYLYRILVVLEAYSEYSVVPVKLKKSSDAILFERITELMQETHGRASRKYLERHLQYSGDYLNKIVKSHTGMNISQYGNHFVAEYSAWLLTNTTRSISDICEELGFSNRASFYKIFKASYGMTPKEYRRKI